MMNETNWGSAWPFVRGSGGAIFIALILTCNVAAETPGERFEKFMKEKAAYCARHKMLKGETTCDILKLKPADPLVTIEGKYAHSLNIPNPVPNDSGYKKGMTSKEYFEHLCQTEAGEFIFKKVENVDGIRQLRPRHHASEYELEHLYALEDPYGHTNTEADRPEDIFVSPDRFQYFDVLQPSEDGVDRHSYRRFHGYDGRNLASMKSMELSGKASRYGFTWRGIRRPYDRELGIAGGELIVLDTEADEVLGVRRGYIRSGYVRNSTGIWWLTGQTCPQYELRGRRNKDFDFTYWFIGKILRPANREESIKGISNGR